MNFYKHERKAVGTKNIHNTPVYILIVANSGRMLAQAARRAGLKPLVIDLFADLDMQCHAEAFKQIPSLAEEHLIPSVDYFIKHYAVEQVIYGSGFEYYPESLCYLGSRLVVLGNPQETFIKLHDKSAFFSSLDKLNIPIPEVSFSAPDSTGHWLVKPMQGQGGVGIKRYHPGDRADSAVYWQKYQAGTQHSVLFLADGRQGQVIGFNTQWTINLNENREFIFSGIINSCDLLTEYKQRIMGWLQKLVPVFALKGLNSLDFIQAGDKSRVLEINPRPSASMQLYDADLFNRHIKASLGELIDNCPHAGYTGYQIVYAERDVLIPDAFAWPEGCMDLPATNLRRDNQQGLTVRPELVEGWTVKPLMVRQAHHERLNLTLSRLKLVADLPESGSLIRTGQPICSIIAHQKQARSVMNELLIKQLNLKKVFSPYGI